MQINTEPEKSAAAANGEAAAAVTLNHGPDDFPALNPIQVQFGFQWITCPTRAKIRKKI